MPLATPVLIAAKTIAINVLLMLPFLLGLATRLAAILGPMKFARAVEASTLTNFFGYVSIDFFQHLMYLLIRQVALAQVL
jgi:hypothetical protein